ncbi:MAG: RcpC/CpaB family pilus assembly protein [Acidimicrobiia bacterium]
MSFSSPGFNQTPQPGHPPSFGGPPPAQNVPEQGRAGRRVKTAPEKKSNSLLKLGVISALGTVALILLILTSAEPSKTYVVKAAQQLSTLSKIDDSMLEAVPVDVEAIEPNTFVADNAADALSLALETIEGAYPNTTVFLGQQIRADAFSFYSNLSETLGPDERLVSVTARPATAMLGKLGIGDIVDIVATDPSNKLSQLVVSGVEIVDVTISPQGLDAAANRQAGADGLNMQPEELLPTTPMPGTYVLRVPVEHAMNLIASDASATLYFVYRGPVVDNMVELDQTGGAPGSVLEGDITDLNSPAQFGTEPAGD